MKYEKFKDALPEDTIKTISDIYRDLGIVMKGYSEKRLDGIYTAILADVNNGWHTCGKGTDEFYSLASAYGESIEHLCSYRAYDKSKISQKAHEYLGFKLYPDEKYYDIDEIPTLVPDVYEDMCDAFAMNQHVEKVLKTWKKKLEEERTAFVPYYSVRRDQCVYLPEAVISTLCGTNGGGAGNTAEEAIGHGLDEITERYVKHEIYKNRLTPPTISLEYLKDKAPELYELIKKIEDKLQVKIVVKDGSMGKGFTVVSVLLVDSVR